MATGRKAFPGNSFAEVMAAVLRDDPTDPKSGPRLPLELQQVVARCLAKRPDQRFQSAGDLAIALKRLGGAEVAATSVEDSVFRCDPAWRCCPWRISPPTRRIPAHSWTA